MLSYATTNREGYREFKSKGYICENCPSRHLCTENQKFEKTVTKHIWSDYLETVEDIRHTPEYKALYERRKETIERVFADAKEKYAMRYTPYRGLSQVTNWVRLKFAAMNLKKYALHRWKRSHQYSALINLYTFFCQNKTHNPKSRLEFRVIRQTGAGAEIRSCLTYLFLNIDKVSVIACMSLSSNGTPFCFCVVFLLLASGSVSVFLSLPSI